MEWMETQPELPCEKNLAGFLSRQDKAMWIANGFSKKQGGKDLSLQWSRKELLYMNHNAIRDLILGNALELYGQPKWTFGKNTCNTYEVFPEKLHLENGEIAPAWPVLELIEQDENLTLLFSNWFFASAMRSAVELQKGATSHLTLSLNLLPAFANREDCTERVLGWLQLTGLDAEHLQFEVSEAQTLNAKGIENLNLMHDSHGVGLLLANFGTGYSNVDLLRDVHFDGLELDRSFSMRIPQHEQTCRVVVGIVHLAHTLDVYVCAKGIETQEQFEFFEELDCLKGQGFLIGKPMCMEELKGYIANYAVKHGKARV
ncbi:MAG: EAL domain-containing protein [Clostridia bacterium]